MSTARFRRRLAAAALWPVLSVASFAGSYTVVGAFLPAGMESAHPASGPPPREAARDRNARRVLRLTVSHDCWSGPAPRDMAHKVPARAVVTLPGRRAAYLSSDVGFAVWAGDRPGTLHAFCR